MRTLIPEASTTRLMVSATVQNITWLVLHITCILSLPKNLDDWPETSEVLRLGATALHFSPLSWEPFVKEGYFMHFYVSLQPQIIWKSFFFFFREVPSANTSHFSSKCVGPLQELLKLRELTFYYRWVQFFGEKWCTVRITLILKGTDECSQICDYFYIKYCSKGYNRSRPGNNNICWRYKMIQISC